LFSAPSNFIGSAEICDFASPLVILLLNQESLNLPQQVMGADRLHQQ
jgi:hypothetical protein